MSKDLPTKKDVARDLIGAIRLLKYVEYRLENYKSVQPESRRQALIDELRLKVLDYLKDR